MVNLFRRRSPEEEEDRARTLLTRRKFLFLGAAAAGAVVANKILPAIPGEYHTYLAGKNAVIGQYADYLDFSEFAVESAIDRAIEYNLHYSFHHDCPRDRELRFAPQFIADLKENTPMFELCRERSLPEAADDKIGLFTYAPLPYTS